MTLYEQTVKDYSELLASSQPAPGGGTASALAGVQGVALASMVAQLTLGRSKYADYEAHCSSILRQTEPLQAQLTELMEKDAQSYLAVSAAFRMPKETEEEKALRSAAIQKATLHATEVPLETMSCGLEGLRLTRQLLGRSNTNAASDLGVAALNLLSCVLGAYLNVEINLPGLKDEMLARTMGQQSTQMAQEARKLSEEIFCAVSALRL